MANITPDYNKLSAIKEAFEGYSSMAYPDSGKVWTIGTGLTYNYNKQRKVQKGDVIDRVTNAKWIAIENKGVLDQLNKYIKVPLNEDQSTAITDYTFNRGIGNLLYTQLDELINANPLDPRIKAEIIGTGLKDRLNHVLWGLGRRRRAEAYLYVTGILKFEWPKWGKADF